MIGGADATRDGAPGPVTRADWDRLSGDLLAEVAERHPLGALRHAAHRLTPTQLEALALENGWHALDGPAADYLPPPVIARIARAYPHTALTRAGDRLTQAQVVTIAHDLRAVVAGHVAEYPASAQRLVAETIPREVLRYAGADAPLWIIAIAVLRVPGPALREEAARRTPEYAKQLADALALAREGTDGPT